jgi:hypothetical protein
MKAKVYQPLPGNMTAVKRKIRAEISKIPEVFVQKFIMNIRGGTSWISQQFEGRKLTMEE